MATLVDTLGFIASEADETDVERLFDALSARRSALRAVRAAAVTIGVKVQIDQISPKYLIGLTGTVTSIKGKRATVTLDEKSTGVLRYAGSRFSVSPDATSYDLTGVPLSCCVPVEATSTAAGA